VTKVALCRYDGLDLPRVSGGHLEPLEGPGLRPKRTRIIGLYTHPPDGATVVCADELGPVIPRAFPPAPGWSPDGHRIKNEIDYSRGPEKTWVYGGLRVRDGQEITMAASSRNSAFCQQFLQQVEDANPTGEIWIVIDNLSSHNSLSTRTWLEDHPRIRHAFIPVGACWLNLQEGWWRTHLRSVSVVPIPSPAVTASLADHPVSYSGRTPATTRTTPCAAKEVGERTGMTRSSQTVESLPNSERSTISLGFFGGWCSGSAGTTRGVRYEHGVRTALWCC
jgi:hypothetical protein